MTYYIVYMAENAVGTYTIKRRRPIKTIDELKDEIYRLDPNWKGLPQA